MAFRRNGASWPSTRTALTSAHGLKIEGQGAAARDLGLARQVDRELAQARLGLGVADLGPAAGAGQVRLDVGVGHADLPAPMARRLGARHGDPGLDEAFVEALDLDRLVALRVELPGEPAELVGVAADAQVVAARGEEGRHDAGVGVELPVLEPVLVALGGEVAGLVGAGGGRQAHHLGDASRGPEHQAREGEVELAPAAGATGELLALDGVGDGVVETPLALEDEAGDDAFGSGLGEANRAGLEGPGGTLALDGDAAGWHRSGRRLVAPLLELVVGGELVGGPARSGAGESDRGDDECRTKARADGGGAQDHHGDLLSSLTSCQETPECFSCFHHPPSPRSPPRRGSGQCCSCSGGPPVDPC